MNPQVHKAKRLIQGFLTLMAGRKVDLRWGSKAAVADNTNIVYLPSPAKGSEEEVALLTRLAVHEAGHMHHTVQGWSDRLQAHARIFFNSLEDPRMEAAQMTAYPGAHIILSRGLGTMLKEILATGPDRFAADPMRALNLDLLVRGYMLKAPRAEIMEFGPGIVKMLEPLITPEQRQALDEALQGLERAQSSLDLEHTASALVLALKEAPPASDSEQPADPAPEPSADEADEATGDGATGDHPEGDGEQGSGSGGDAGGQDQAGQPSDAAGDGASGDQPQGDGEQGSGSGGDAGGQDQAGQPSDAAGDGASGDHPEGDGEQGSGSGGDAGGQDQPGQPTEAAGDGASGDQPQGDGQQGSGSGGDAGGQDQAGQACEAAGDGTLVDEPQGDGEQGSGSGGDASGQGQLPKLGDGPEDLGALLRLQHAQTFGSADVDDAAEPVQLTDQELSQLAAAMAQSDPGDSLENVIAVAVAALTSATGDAANEPAVALAAGSGAAEEGSTNGNAERGSSALQGVQSRLVMVLQRELQDRRRKHSRPATTGSRVLPGRFWRLGAVGDTRLFAGRQQVAGIDAAAAILIDRSGSMYERLQVALEAGVAFSLALQRLRVATRLSVFPAEVTEDQPFGLPQAEVLQPFGQAARAASEKALAVEASGGTPMGEAMLDEIAALTARRELKKFLIVVTDGMPDIAATVENARDAANMAGIEILGVGIGLDISGLIPWSTSIESIDELPSALEGLFRSGMVTKLAA